MSEGAEFTGERLHADDPRFALDLARHRAAYEWARPHLAGVRRVLDLGCGSGYGAASLAPDAACLVAFDRVPPDRASRGAVRFVRGDFDSGLPFRPGSFERVLSFQVIEHLEDPRPYLDGIAGLLAPGGFAVLTTPNILMSDGVNPFHVHEYRAEELRELLARHFASVELLGVGATPEIHAQIAEKSRRIRRILRLDPLGLRHRLPRPLIEWLFAQFAKLVRSGASGAAAPQAPAVDWTHFPVGPPADDCLDLLAICRNSGGVPAKD